MTDKLSKRTSDFFKNLLRGKMNNKALLITVVAMLGGGGGLAIFDFVTRDEMDQALGTVTEKENDRHAKIDAILTKQNENVSSIKDSVETIQGTLNKQVARQEALRVTEDAKIKNRLKWQETYNRLYDLNMYRLDKDKEPCQTLLCNN